MFDHKNITRTNYYFVVGENGQAWTDTAFYDVAIQLADTLKRNGKGKFTVQDSTGVIYNTEWTRTDLLRMYSEYKRTGNVTV